MARVDHYAITSTVAAWAGDDLARHAFICACFARHERGDWGDVDRDDWQANDRARHQRSGRVLSAYTAPAALAPTDACLWIITDDLDSTDPVTTILWPSDY